MNEIKIDIIDQRGVWKTYKSNAIPRPGELVYIEDKIKWFKVGTVIHGTKNDVILLWKEVDIDNERYYG